jgi:hypothetical protein
MNTGISAASVIMEREIVVFRMVPGGLSSPVEWSTRSVWGVGYIYIYAAELIRG